MDTTPWIIGFVTVSPLGLYIFWLRRFGRRVGFGTFLVGLWLAMFLVISPWFLIGLYFEETHRLGHAARFELGYSAWIGALTASASLLPVIMVQSARWFWHWAGSIRPPDI